MFDFFLLCLILLIPLSLICMGLLFVRRPPENINWLFGYRTPLSMKNKDTWDFAHRYFGRLATRTGSSMLVVTIPVIALLWGRNSDIIGWASAIVCLLQCIILLALIYPTERALKRTFDADGKRRN